MKIQEFVYFEKGFFNYKVLSFFNYLYKNIENNNNLF